MTYEAHLAGDPKASPISQSALVPLRWTQPLSLQSAQGTALGGPTLRMESCHWAPGFTRKRRTGWAWVLHPLLGQVLLQGRRGKGRHGAVAASLSGPSHFPSPAWK